MQQPYSNFFTSRARAFTRHRTILRNLNERYCFGTDRTSTPPNTIPKLPLTYHWQPGLLNNMVSARRTIAHLSQSHKRLFSSTPLCKSSSRWYRGKNESLARNLNRAQSLQKKPAIFYTGSRFRLLLDRIPHNVIVWGVLGVNAVIYIAWQYATYLARDHGDYSLLRTMFNNYAFSWQNIEEGRIWTMITSAFSHAWSSHFLLNAMSYYFIAPHVIYMLGNTAFLTLYLTGGIVCCISSVILNKSLRDRASYCYGASGAIFAVTTYFACEIPHATFLLFYVVPTPAWMAVTGLFIWDLLSALSDKQSLINSAGHVGGILTGAAYFLVRRRSETFPKII